MFYQDKAQVEQEVRTMTDFNFDAGLHSETILAATSVFLFN